MRAIIVAILRIANRVSGALLSRRMHFRLQTIARAALNAYLDGARPFLETSETVSADGPKPVRRHVDRDDVGDPLSSFIGSDGKRIDPGRNFQVKLCNESRSCKLVLCCAFTGRHRIIEKIVNESLMCHEARHVRWMLVGSTPEDDAFIKTLSCQTGQVAGFVMDNNPLGRKWQTCMNYATRYYESDLYGITGSDDFVSSRLVDFIIRRHQDNMEKGKASSFVPAMYGTLEWLVCNTNTQDSLVPLIIKCSYAYETAFEPLGAGRFYTRAFMEECKGLIFESDLERLLDDRGFFEVRDRGKPLEYYSLEDGPIVSVKGDWAQMNSVADFITAPTLTLDEYSFSGHALLRRSLSDASFKFLFKPATIFPQLNFSKVSTGID